MNELSLFEQNEKVMTVKELAIELRVAESTVKNIITELRQVVGGVFEDIKRNSQNGYLLNEKQATAIKLKLRQRNNLKDDSAVMQIGNDLEFFALLKKRDEEQKKLDAYRDRRIAELKERAEVAESALARIENGKGCYSLAQTAKALKLPYGRNTLNDKLKQMGLLLASGEPYQDQINAGHFKVIVKHVNDYVGNKPVTLTTGKGLVYLAKRFNTVIDESIKADA